MQPHIHQRPVGSICIWLRMKSTHRTENLYGDMVGENVEQLVTMQLNFIRLLHLGVERLQLAISVDRNHYFL